MLYLISQLWFWLLLALAIGLGVGWMTFSHEPRRWRQGWVPWGLAAFGVGLLFAIFRLLPDRLGYYLDAALLFTTAYGIGCFLSGLWRQRQEPAPAVARRAVAPVAAAKPAPAPASAPVAVAAPVALAAPVAVAPPPAPAPGEDHLTGSKPKVMAGPRGGKADDLKRIRGIGKQNEGRLHALGIWHFDQIAGWTADEVEWVGGYLAFPGRIEREDWQAQAKVLASGADTAFSKRVDKGEVASSKDDGAKGQGNVADLAGLAREKPKPN